TARLAETSAKVTNPAAAAGTFHPAGPEGAAAVSGVENHFSLEWASAWGRFPATGRQDKPQRPGEAQMARINVLVTVWTMLVSLWGKLWTGHRCKILFTAANTLEDKKLRLDEEVRDTELAILRSARGRSVELVKKVAVRLNDLQAYLQEEKPQVLHFSGHAGRNQGLYLFPDQPGKNPFRIVKPREFGECLRGAGKTVRLM